MHGLLLLEIIKQNTINHPKLTENNTKKPGDLY